MTRPLALSPVFRGLREALLTKAATRLPVCDRCGQPVEPDQWTLHRTQLCPGARSHE